MHSAQCRSNTATFCSCPASRNTGPYCVGLPITAHPASAVSYNLMGLLHVLNAVCGSGQSATCAPISAGG